MARAELSTFGRRSRVPMDELARLRTQWLELARLRTQNVYPVTGLHRQRRRRNRMVLGTMDSASLRNRNHFGDLEGLEMDRINAL